MALILSGVGGIWLTHQAMQPIEKSFRRLQQFTADASHELRNPLRAIKSNSAVALKCTEDIRALDAEKFRAIASATTQMTALTEDLLVLAQTDQVPTPTQNRVNLTVLLEDLVQLYRAEAEIKQIDLKGKILEHLEVFGDLVQLNRLFTNLISKRDVQLSQTALTLNPSPRAGEGLCPTLAPFSCLGRRGWGMRV